MRKDAVRIRFQRLLGGAAMALSLVAGSGCYCSLHAWKWAAERVPMSRAPAVERGPEGGERVSIRMRGCTGRPDGLYALEIPSGWRERPRRASPWGSDVEETTGPVASIVPFAPAEGRVERRRVMPLDLEKVVDGSPPPRGCAYGAACVPGKDGYSVEVFGYIALPVGERAAAILVARNRRKEFAHPENFVKVTKERDARRVQERARRGVWVHLGGVAADAGRVRPGRMLLAVLATCAALPLDLAMAPIELPYWLAGDPSFMADSDVPRLMARLEIPSPEERAQARTRTPGRDDFYAPAAIDYEERCAKAARKLRDYGARGRAAVPALRALALNTDPRARSQALGTLQALGAVDDATLDAMRRSSDEEVRRDATFYPLSR